MALCGTPDGRVFALGKDFRNVNSKESFNDDRLFGIPRLFDLPIQVTQMSVGRDHAVLLSSDGLVYTFGSNQWGQLGISSNFAAQYAVQVLKPTEYEDEQNSDSDGEKKKRSNATKPSKLKLPHLKTFPQVKLDYFENPVTSEKFEYSSNPI